MVETPAFLSLLVTNTDSVPIPIVDSLPKEQHGSIEFIDSVSNNRIGLVELEFRPIIRSKPPYWFRNLSSAVFDTLYASDRLSFNSYSGILNKAKDRNVFIVVDVMPVKRDTLFQASFNYEVEHEDADKGNSKCACPEFNGLQVSRIKYKRRKSGAFVSDSTCCSNFLSIGF